MQGLAINRVELELLNDRFRLGVTDGEVNNLRVRAVNQFTNVSCSNGERAVQTTAIDVAGNQLLCAESLSGFLAVLATRSTYKCKFFHFSKVLCYSIWGNSFLL